MAYLSEKNGAFEQDITLQNQDLTITLPTNGKYLNKSIILNVSAQDGDVRIPSGTAIEVTPEIEIDSNGTITATISTAQNIAPTVYTDGWVDSNSISATNISVEGSNTYELGAKTSQDLTSNGATVYAPAGYYPLQAQKSIGNGTLQLTGGGLTAGSGNVSITSDGLYNAINGLNTVDQMEITATPPTGTDNYYQITVSGSGSVSRAAAYAQVTKNGYLSSSANKTIAADSISSNTQQTSYYILKATRNVTNGSISATNGSVTITPSGIITSQTDTGFGLTVEATGGSASIGASTVSVGAGYNPAPINAGTSTRNVTGQTVTETKYIQAGAITASISSNTAGAASMSAHGLTPLASGTSDYYVQLSTTNGQVQATASTETEGYIKNASDVSDAVTVDVNGNGDKLYLAAATLGSEGSITSNPTVTITNSTTMATTNTNTGYSFTVGNNVTNGTVQTKYKATTEGYTSVRTATNGGTVSVAPIVSGNTTVYIKGSTLSNTASNDVSYTDITDNSTILTSSGYLYINEGYTPNRMISLAHLIPDDANLSSNASMLEGVTAYDSNGVLYTGTIPIRTSEDILISGKSVTTAAGYYADAIVTSIGLGTITSPNSIATFSGPSYDSSTGKFTISAGGTIAEPTVNTAGYISTTEGTRNSGAISGSTTLNKIGLSTSHSGVTTAVTPVISKQTISINGVIDAAGGAATTTAPSSGVYVAVKSAANKGNLVSTPAVSSAGYGTTTNGQYSASTATSEVGANESSMTYIPITTTSASKSGASVTFGTGWITGNTITVDSGDYSATVSSHTISTNPVVSGKILGSINSITTSTKPSGADGVDYWVIIPNGEVTTTGYSTAVGEADIDTAGWINTGNKTQATPSTVSITPTINNGTTIYLPKVALETSYIDAATADVTVEPGTIHIDSNTANVTNKTRLDYAPTASAADINKYFIAVQATADANNNGDTAPVTGLMQASVATPGYAPSSFKVNWTIDGIATGATSAKTSDAYYIPIPTAAFTTTENKVYCNTAGYVPQGSTSNVVGTVNPGTITSGTGNITTVAKTYNSTSGKFDITGSANISAPTVDTAGYISSSLGTKNIKNNGATVNATIDKIVGATAITGTFTYKPSISRQDVPSGVTQASSGPATTTAPTSGVYVAVKSALNTGTITATPSVTSAGYGTSDHHGIEGNTATVGAQASDMTYIPIALADMPTYEGGTLSGNSTATGTNVTLSTTDNGMKIQTAYTAHRDAILYNDTIEGWIKIEDNTQAIAAQDKSSTNGTAYYITGVTMPKDKGFTVTTTADTALDTNSDLDVTNNAYRRVDITNAANGTVLVSNTGTTEITSASTSAGKVTIKAKVAAGDPSTTNQDVVVNGLWKNNVVSTGGTYYGRTVIGNATFASTATSGKTYADASNSGPVLVAGDYLYINEGYTPYQKISLARLVPDGSDVKGHAEYIIEGHSAYDNDGILVSGSIPTLVSEDISVNGATVTIPLGKYTGASGGTAVTKTIDSGTVSTTFTGDGMSTYFNSGTSSDKNVTITPKYTNTAGYISAHSTATNNGGTAYYKIKTASPTFSAAPTGGSTASSSQVTMDTTSTSAGIEIQTAYTVNAATISYAAAATGWIDKAANATTGSSTTAKTSTNGTKYYVTKVTVPKAKTFTVETAANTSADNAALTVTNGAYRKVTLTNAANGTATITNNGTIDSLTNAGTITAITNNSSKTITNIANSGTIKVTSGSATAGTLTVNAYNNAATPALTGAQNVVTNGKWVATSVSAAGTYYGRVTVGSGSASTNFINTGINTYFDNGTSSNNSISITPRYSTSAGYIDSASNVNGTTSYYKIKTASPTFSAAPTGSSTAEAVGSSCSISNSTNNSGISIQTKYSINAVAINYAAAATGWIDKTANSATGSSTSAKSATNGTAYYINGVTLTAPTSGTRSFTITVPNGSANDNVTFTFTVDSSYNVTIT